MLVSGEAKRQKPVRRLRRAFRRTPDTGELRLRSLRVVIVITRRALPRLGRGRETILSNCRLLLTKQTTHRRGLGRIFAVAALDAMLSLNSRDLGTSRRHLRGIGIDTSTLVVHACKNPVSKVLPWRKVYWSGRGRDGGRAAGYRARCCNASDDASLCCDDVSCENKKRYDIEGLFWWGVIR
jgi:hypothetical protein